MTRFKLRAYGQARYLLWAMALLVAIPAWANKSGVAPSRLKLPQGPGSLEGLGENAEIRPNMGLMSYGINIEVPKGYNSTAPGLRLDYSSGNGNSVVGVGWSFTIPEISRMTSKGLPTYTLDDTFSGESGELVYVGDFNGARVYRARFEGGFIRYQWKNAGAGTGGYWIAEYPTGARAYFGADANGRTDESSRVVGSDGVFRYHLVEHHDALGHKVVYGYHKSEGLSLLDTVHWGFENNTPHYEVALEYESRPDQTSQGQPGFLVKLAERIKTLRVRVDGQKLRRYKLNY